MACYHHDLILLDPGDSASALLSQRSDWKIIYRDEGSILFARVKNQE